jgi:hypothetical protein
MTIGWIYLFGWRRALELTLEIGANKAEEFKRMDGYIESYSIPVHRYTLLPSLLPAPHRTSKQSQTQSASYLT